MAIEQWSAMFQRAASVEQRLAVIRGMELEGGTDVLRFLMTVAADAGIDARVRGEALQVLITRPNLHGDKEWPVRRELGAVLARIGFTEGAGELREAALRYVVSFADVEEVRGMAREVLERADVDGLVRRVAGFVAGA